MLNNRDIEIPIFVSSAVTSISLVEDIFFTQILKKKKIVISSLASCFLF